MIEMSDETTSTAPQPPTDIVRMAHDRLHCDARDCLECLDEWRRDAPTLLATIASVRTALREALDIATYYTGDGTDPDAMDICKVHAARIAELRGLADGAVPGTSARLASLESEISRIRPVYQAACAARDRRREYAAIEPEEDGRYADERATRDRWLDATHAVDAAADRARGDTLGRRSGSSDA